jgi:hypothetical protein
MEGVLIFPIVRRAIFFTVGVDIGVSCFTGICAAGVIFSEVLFSAGC